MKLAPLSLIVTIAYLVQGTPLPVAKDVKLNPDVVGYANGPDSYWVRDIEGRAKDVKFEPVIGYANGPNSYWVRDVEGVKLDPDIVGYANGPNSYWVRDVEGRAKKVDADVVGYANGPDSYWVRGETYGAVNAKPNGPDCRSTRPVHG